MGFPISERADACERSGVSERYLESVVLMVDHWAVCDGEVLAKCCNGFMDIALMRAPKETPLEGDSPMDHR